MTGTFTIDKWNIDPTTNRIWTSNHSIVIPPKEMEVLCYLSQRAPGVVDREELLAEVWKGVFVNENTINRIIANLRKSLEDDWKNPSIIETVSKSGYRIIGNVNSLRKPILAGLVSKTAIGVSLVIFIGILFLAIVNIQSGDHRYFESKPITSFPGLELEADLSPDQTLVAFSKRDVDKNQFDIYVNVIGTDSFHPLATSEHSESNPVWSNSGKHLIYTKAVDDRFEVHKTTLYGERTTKIATFDTDPTVDWSNNEKWLLFTDESPNGSVAIYGYEIETSNRYQLTFPPAGSYGDLEPTFSPSNNKIAFRRIFDEYVQDLFVLSLNDTSEHRLTNGNIRVSGISWQATEDKISFASLDGGQWKISSINPSKKSLSTLHLSDRLATHPNYATDQNQFVYVRWNSLQNLQYISFDNFENPTTIGLNSVMIDRDPSVNGNGDLIFISDRSGSDELWLAKVGESPIQLTNLNGPTIDAPKWSPDNTNIVFELREDGNVNLKYLSIEDQFVKSIPISSARNPSWLSSNEILFSTFETDTWITKSIELKTEKIKTIHSNSFRAIMSNGTVYYSKYGVNGIWKDNEQLINDLDWNDYGNWVISNGSIYYYNRSGNSINTYNLTTQSSQEIARLEKMIPTYSHSLDVNMKEKLIVVSIIESLESDVMLATDL